LQDDEIASFYAACSIVAAIPAEVTFCLVSACVLITFCPFPLRQSRTTPTAQISGGILGFPTE
jgi:hypothetical protein